MFRGELVLCLIVTVFASTELFDRWAAEIGIQRNEAIAIQTKESGYRGVFAVKAIAKGDQLLFVPQSAFLAALYDQTAADLGRRLYNRDTRISAQEELALVLMWVAKFGPPAERLRWKGFVAILPVVFETPIYWSQDMLDQARGSHIVQLCKQRRVALQTRFDVLHDVLPDMKLDDFRWAMSVVVSRGFRLQVDNEAVKGFAPYADLFNSPSIANQSPNVRVESKGPIYYFAASDIAAGEELTVSYGSQHDNTSLLMDYGFRILGGRDFATVEFEKAVFKVVCGAGIPIDLLTALRRHHQDLNELKRFELLLTLLEDKLSEYRSETPDSLISQQISAEKACIDGAIDSILEVLSREL